MAVRRPPVRVSLDGSLDLAGLEAARADIHPLGVSLDQRANALDVWVPASGRTTVRVRDLHAEARFAPTHFTYGCHNGCECYRAAGCPATGRFSGSARRCLVGR